MVKRIVVKVTIIDEKQARKALKISASLSGVESVSLNRLDKLLTVTGDVDPVELIPLLSKGVGYAEIVSVGPAKEKWEHLKIRLIDIKLATENFTKGYIGSGAYCKVYAAELKLPIEEKSKSDISKKKKSVVIKCIKKEKLGEKEFAAEIELLSRCNHDNLDPLLGFCVEGLELILIYEHAFNGSLDDYLGITDNSFHLTWAQRLKICIDSARGLQYLHNMALKDEESMIHRDIRSRNILISKNWEGRLANFGLSRFHHANQQDNPLSENISDTEVYICPEYRKEGKLNTTVDIYSFGVVLLEILSGKLAYDKIYIEENDDGIAHVARRHFNQGTLTEMVDSKIMEEVDELTSVVNKGPNKDSLNTFIAIAHRCVGEIQKERPTAEQVLHELETALSYQPSRKFAHLQIRLQEVVSATKDFADENLIMQGRSGKTYTGQLWQSGELIDIIVRRLDRMYVKEIEFWTEISMLFSLEHKNIVSIVGFCFEKGEKIVIYEHAVHGSLDRHLTDATLTWFQKLQICLGAARALSYVHYDVIHCDIDSSKIFLDEDWEAKVYGFELSTKYPESWRHRLQLSQHFDTIDYIDPVHMRTGTVTPKYDVYLFGLILFEVLGVTKPVNGDGGVNQSVAAYARNLYQEKQLDELIEPKLKKEMDLQSLNLFSEIAYNCLNKERDQRPTMDQVVRELEDVLELRWKRENIEHATAAYEGTSFNHLKMEWLRIPFSDIKSATESFNTKYCIGSGGYGVVYKADLDHVDIHTLSSMEAGNKDELPKNRSTVAIKQIINRQDEQDKQGFLAEIELLTRCKHQNVVSLLGFSSKDREMILVFEFLVNGSLDGYLGSTKRKINLTWNQRVRICLHIAEGLKYLHTSMEGKPRIIHRDIKSANILLDKDWNAKIADFGLSKFHPANQLASTIQSKNIAGTEVYLDPEYLTTGKYKKESDIYSFGVVLFEILSGSLAYNPVYLKENNQGLAPIARRCFNEGTLKELIDPKMMEEDDVHSLTINRGPNQESFDAFSKIAYQCLAETQARRPTMEVVIKELHNALNIQGKTTVLLKFQFSDIVKATGNFAETYCIDSDAYSMVYKAKVELFASKCSSSIEEKNNGEQSRKWTTVAIKRISSRNDGRGEQEFFKEIEMQTSYKHPNIVSLLGFCDKGSEKIIVYEHASNGSLQDYLTSTDNITTFSWKQRLDKCLEIARGLKHLHTKIHIQQTPIHGDIKSANILLGKNLETKIAYFGISKLNLVNQDAIIANTNDIIATKVYWDPDYEKTGKMDITSDIYSFGVVLFEIFCGRLAYDPIYIAENDKGLAPIARRCYNDGTIKKMIDPKLLEATDEDIFTSNKGTNQDSLDTFLKTAYHCLGETQAERPRMETVITELEKALDFQENVMRNLHISLPDIKLATHNFNQESCIRSGRDWKAYKGETPHANANGRTTIVAKRWNSKTGQGDYQFRKELDILFKHKHENIIGLVGYCNEMNETIIIYEHESKGSLDKFLNDATLTWMKRLKICIDVASGLEFLHGGAVMLKKVVHRDLKSASILLTGDCKAKISNLELSLDSLNQDMEQLNSAFGTFGYLDPEYAESGFLTEKSDIYSFGVILFETLCGRLAWAEGCVDDSQSLGPLAKRKYEDRKLEEIVFEGIKKEIVPQSLTTFAGIAYQCIRDVGNERPKASEVLVELKKALEYQEDGEIWEPKLPRNYKEIIAMTENPDKYYNNKKRDLFKKLCKGIFLQDEKVWFSLSSAGKGNALISATMFCYESRRLPKWRCIQKPTTRFHRVAKMADLSKLQIEIKINTTFLSPDVVYRVHFIFKFCNPGKSSKNLMYVNINYNMGFETLHAYFATKKGEDDGWMMIDLCRFLNNKEHMTFEISLESFSRCYCGSGAIYVQGLEFEAIDNMKNEEIENLKGVKQVTKSNLNVDEAQQLPINLGETSKKSENNYDGEELSLLSKVNGKIDLTLSAKSVFYNPSKMKPSTESRFQDVAELQRYHVLRIKYKIEIEKLSPFTKYSCYLVFKLSEKCRGLHCPVKVQDLPRRKCKETQTLYLRSPAPWNQHDGIWFPKQRKDGLMEVMLWNFNSKHKPGENYIPMNLQLTTYEGTLSGLIISGLEIRPS